MSENVVNLNRERAMRSNRGDQWTVADALRECLDMVESGRFPADKVVICLSTDYGEDNRARPAFATAGVSQLEAQGLLNVVGLSMLMHKG